jgi:hypothetical protein
MEVTGRRGRRGKQLIDYLKEKRGYRKELVLEEAVDLSSDHENDDTRSVGRDGFELQAALNDGSTTACRPHG